MKMSIYASYFGPKCAKMNIFDVFDPFLEPNMASITKNDKTTIMRDKYLDVLNNSREKNISTTLFVYLLWGNMFRVYFIDIFDYVAKMVTFQNEVAQLQIFFQISKNFAFEL